MTVGGRKRLLYLSLVALRAIFAFAPGYIHPDEWFQYGEVLSGDYYDIDVLRTWEFDPSHPCRSMASIRLFGLPFALLGKNPSARLLFVTSRCTFLLVSFLLDWSAWQVLSGHARWKGLLLWAGSGAVMAFSVRPFSNNVEAAMMALCFVGLQRLTLAAHSKNVQKATWNRWSMLLGLVTSLGIFSRFTFAIFALPIGVCLVRLAWMKSSTGKSRWKTTALSLSGAALTSLVIAILHILYDSWYYSPPQSKSFWPPTIAPINAALYNLKRDNLANHGVHPRWLHVIINAPMMIGIGPWLHCIFFFVGQGRPFKTTNSSNADLAMFNKVLVSTVVFSLAILSIQPHQEPRFLLPLVFPCCILFAQSRSSNKGFLLSATLIQSLAIVVFFGFLHQGGTIPAMLNVHSKLSSIVSADGATSIQFFFWRSFMPPRHLIVPFVQDRYEVAVKDCQSMPLMEIADTIATAASSTTTSIILFLPFWVLNEEARTIFTDRRLTLTPLTPSFLHVDTDHLPESFSAHSLGSTLRQSFSYAAYTVQQT